MDANTLEALIESILKDDVKKFRQCMEKEQCGSYRLGRFPVLSALYLMDAKRIISAYEDVLIRYGSWKELREPETIAAAFRKKAGKALRFYLEETVTPIEMLLVLDKTARVKRLFPVCRPSAAVKQRLKDIYAIKYSLSLECEGDAVVMERRPRTRAERKKILIACICSVLCAAIIICTPFVVNVFAPFMGDAKVISISSLDLSTSVDAELKNNAVVKENFEGKTLAARLNGNGRTLKLDGGSTKTPVYEKLTGSIKNLVVNTDGSRPLFDTIDIGATVEDLTVNVDASGVFDVSTAFLALNNYGTIKNVTVNISGNMTVEGERKDAENQDVDPTIVAGLVLNNSVKASSYVDIYIGTIQNCTVNCDELLLFGNGADTMFCGICGKNGAMSGIGAQDGAARIKDCVLEGSIVSDTLDVAGFNYINYGYGIIVGCENRAKIVQSSANENWSPLVAGISVGNGGTISKCRNAGELESECRNAGELESDFTADDVSSVARVAGICLENSGKITSCENSGRISAHTKFGYAFGAGISMGAFRNSSISKSENTAEIDVSGETVVAGGIAAYAYSVILSSRSAGKITAEGTTCYVGGILGCASTKIEDAFFMIYVYKGSVESCISEDEITVTAEKVGCVGGLVGEVTEVDFAFQDETVYYGGMVLNSYFVGAIDISGKAYKGGIIGVCGKNTHETNSFVSGTNEYKYFENNVCINTFELAVGATASYSSNENAFLDIAEAFDGDNAEAELLSLEEIKSSEGYKRISEALS